MTQQLRKTATARPVANSLNTARNALLYTQASKRKAKIEAFKWTAGGLDPLHVSMPRKLKSRPTTSPTHPGRLVKRLGPIFLMHFLGSL